ncbi:hypothetical protein M0802_004352 [Mischocyttarus mexicanus]|nr:hypothetical protein M0802_004352 [Mischocyttarus mexicanus]
MKYSNSKIQQETQNGVYKHKRPATQQLNIGIAKAMLPDVGLLSVGVVGTLVIVVGSCVVVVLMVCGLLVSVRYGSNNGGGGDDGDGDGDGGGGGGGGGRSD